jgi:hypothetical protein
VGLEILQLGNIRGRIPSIYIRPHLHSILGTVRCPGMSRVKSRRCVGDDNSGSGYEESRRGTPTTNPQPGHAGFHILRHGGCVSLSLTVCIGLARPRVSQAFAHALWAWWPSWRLRRRQRRFAAGWRLRRCPRAPTVLSCLLAIAVWCRVVQATWMPNDPGMPCSPRSAAMHQVFISILAPMHLCACLHLCFVGRSIPCRGALLPPTPQSPLRHLAPVTTLRNQRRRRMPARQSGQLCCTHCGRVHTIKSQACGQSSPRPPSPRRTELHYDLPQSPCSHSGCGRTILDEGCVSTSRVYFIFIERQHTAVFAVPAQATTTILAAAPDTPIPSQDVLPYSESWSEVGAGTDGRATWAVVGVPTGTESNTDQLQLGTFTGA